MNTVYKPQDNQSALLSQYCAVSSYTEWEPLEEVIVGVVDARN